jgi:ABC-type branched-subunit amino acid transport system permease subunit
LSGTALAVAVIVGLCALPPFISSSYVLVMFLSFVWLTITANYDVLDGFLGHINLGQGAFFGLGAADPGRAAARAVGSAAGAVAGARVVVGGGWRCAADDIQVCLSR